MDILIQYEGFVVLGASRVYSFLVVDALRGSRQFTVHVPQASFSRLTALKFQDGPQLSFQRLKQELDSETEQSRLETHLSINIGERDVQDYIDRHAPRKRS